MILRFYEIQEGKITVDGFSPLPKRFRSWFRDCLEVQALSRKLNTDCVEIHTGRISDLIKNNKNYTQEYKKISECCKLAEQIGLKVHAGHGLDYKTTAILSRLKQIEEFNIGHFIIGESILHGIKKTIKKFKKILNKWKWKYLV